MIRRLRACISRAFQWHDDAEPAREHGRPSSRLSPAAGAPVTRMTFGVTAKLLWCWGSRVRREYVVRVRILSLISALSILWTAIPAQAQQSTEIPYLGYMSPGDIPRYDNAFLQGLERQGYILPGEIRRYDDAFWHGLVKRGSFSGKKIRIEVRASVDRFPERVPALAAELVNLDVDVLFVSTPPEALAARDAVKRANKTIPIVFGPHPDPVGAGLVASLARPGASITGLVLSAPELEAKRLEVFVETFPRLSRIAYLHEGTFYPPAMSLKAKQAVQAAARTMGLQLEVFEVYRPEELEGVLSQIARTRAEAIMLSGGPLLLTARRPTVEFVAKRRLPAMYSEALFVEAGGLMFYGNPYADWYGHAASVVAKILKGTKAIDIPVEQPRDFKLLINLSTAKTLGITIPQSVLLRAEAVDTLER